jgi:protocatechuate 3,4-dioxygenase beta subunit
VVVVEPASLVRARLFVLLVAGILASACAGPGAGGSRAAATPSVPPAAAGQGASPALDQPAAQSAAPACSGRPTPAQTEGPYFKAGSPERASLLEPGLQGTRLTLTGRVLSVGCQPLVGTVLDFWQADASGAYDNRGYRLRGHQLTGAGGAYSLETIVPGQYPGRTEHIHVKVQPPGRPVLTTQLYFPGVARNQQDSIFDPALLVDMKDGAGGKTATFDFIVPVG